MRGAIHKGSVAGTFVLSLQFSDACVEWVAVLGREWSLPLDPIELFLEERWEAVERGQDAAKRIGSPEDNPADGMKKDCAGAHEARLEGRKECHFARMGAKMRWQ